MNMVLASAMDSLTLDNLADMAGKFMEVSAPFVTAVSTSLVAAVSCPVTSPPEQTLSGLVDRS